MGSKSVSTTSARKTSSPSIEQKIKVLWTALQVAGKQQEKRGIDFGKALYELRESSQARRNWLEVIEKLGIPTATAYRWITRYEEVLGDRPKKLQPIHVAKPIEIAPEPIPEPAPRTGMTIEERDNQQLRDFTHRLTSVTSALKTLIANDASECSEYHNMVKAAKVLAKVIEKL